jgi:hypothetical protein
MFVRAGPVQVEPPTAEQLDLVKSSIKALSQPKAVGETRSMVYDVEVHGLARVREHGCMLSVLVSRKQEV